jgi:hypothetical protein
MASGADFNPQVLFGRTGLKSVSANAGSSCFKILRMDSVLHGFYLSLMILPEIPIPRVDINITRAETGGQRGKPRH